MTTYRKTATVEAVQWTGDNLDEIRAFLGDDLVDAVDYGPEAGCLIVNTLEGDIYYSLGYWIIRNPAGEHYGCADDVFRSTYVEHDPAGASLEVLGELVGLFDDEANGLLPDGSLIAAADRIVALVLEGAIPQPLDAG